MKSEIGNVDLSEYYTKTESDDKYALKSEIGNVDLSGYYTKTESDNRFALKSEIGNVDLSGYYTKTESDDRFALKSESSSSIDWSNIREDSISITASNRIYLSAGGDSELYCDGVFRLTSPNGLHISGQPLYDESEDSFYATENYVNTKIGEININDLIAGVLNGFEIESSNRISLYTSNKLDLTAESNDY